MSLQKHSPGFTLLEVSVIVVIVGLLMGSFLSFYQTGRDIENINETKLRIDRVFNAISAFALMNNRLPCPANPSSHIGAMGSETATCPDPAGLGISRGIIPYRTLGLTYEDAMDGYGNFMTYIVRESITAPPSNPNVDVAADLTTSRFCQNTGGTIRVDRLVNFMQVTEPDITAMPAAQRNVFVAVISHGLNAFGGYNMGNTNLASRSQLYGETNALSTPEYQNSVALQPMVMYYPYNPRRAPSGGWDIYFDDIAGYMTNFQIISRLGSNACHDPPPPT